MDAKRYAILDLFRGLVLISMIAYHAIWDMVYIYGEQWNWYKSDIAYLWQQSICWSFILLSGFCWNFGRHKLKRGIVVFVAGSIISMVTILVMPANVVIFGVLTLLGTSMLLMIPLDRILHKIDSKIGLCFATMLFVITRNINKGSLGFEKWEILNISDHWYGYLGSADANFVDWVATYVGFTAKDFFSTDYFSVFPWFFLFMVGYFLYQIMNESNWLEQLKPSCSKHFEWLGRHSLLIYMVHQPIIYAVLALWYYFTRNFC